MASQLQLVISWSIPAALLGLGALTAFAVVAAVRIGGRREESLDDHDALSASQVVSRLTGLTPEELRAVRAYEEGSRGRRTVLLAIDRLLT